jgi:hypothetical protein
VAQRQRRDAADLISVINAAIVFPPRGFLRIAEQVRASKVMMMADFRAAQTAEIALRPICATASRGRSATKKCHLKA